MDARRFRRHLVYRFILYFAFHTYFHRPGPIAPDFKIYFEAAKGNFGYEHPIADYKAAYGFQPTWLYANWTSFVLEAILTPG